VVKTVRVERGVSSAIRTAGAMRNARMLARCRNRRREVCRFSLGIIALGILR